MYLTRLVLNPRVRRVQQEVARPYQMHRTLMRCFPGDLAPAEERVLFRVEESRHTGAVTVLMQSLTEPRWGWLEDPGARGYLVPMDQPNPWVKTFNPQLREGQTLAFRLLANPTVKRAGKRLGLYGDEDQRVWIERKAQQSGFRLLGVRVARRPPVEDAIQRNKGHSHRVVLVCAQFEGILQVTEPVLLLDALCQGIGSGKGFGFGLLSLAKAK